MNFLEQILLGWALVTGVSIAVQIIILLAFLVLLILFVRWIVKQAQDHPALTIILIALLIIGGVVMILASAGTLTIAGIPAIISGLISIILTYPKLNKKLKK